MVFSAYFFQFRQKSLLIFGSGLPLLRRRKSQTVDDPEFDFRRGIGQQDSAGGISVKIVFIRSRRHQACHFECTAGKKTFVFSVADRCHSDIGTAGRIEIDGDRFDQFLPVLIVFTRFSQIAEKRACVIFAFTVFQKKACFSHGTQHLAQCGFFAAHCRAEGFQCAMFL